MQGILTQFGGGAATLTFLSPTPPVSYAVVWSLCVGPPAGGGSRTSTVSFSKPVIDPIIHVVNLDASRLVVTGTSTTGAPITLTPLVKNNALEISGNTLNATLQTAVNVGCATNGGANGNGGCGSIQIGAASGAIGSITLGNNTTGSALASNYTDGWEYTLSYPTAPLTKAFSPSTISAGATSQLTFTIANPANTSQPTLTPLDFTDALPTGVTLANGAVSNNGNCGAPSVTDSGGGALAAGGTSVKASNISVAVGATCTITVNVTAAAGGSYTNDNSDLSTSVANLVPNANTTLTVLAADLAIVKSAPPGPITTGGTFVYTLTVTNNGPNDATGVSISDPLPAEVSYVSDDGGCSEAAGTVTCPIGALANGASAVVHVTVSADSAANPSTNTATVSGTGPPDPDATNNSSSADTIIVDPGVLRVVKSLNPHSDPGRFDLQIDGATAGSGSAVGNGGTTGPITLAPGTHTVGEVAHAPTKLSNYTARISCTNGSSVKGGGPLAITVISNGTITCTITNTRRPTRPSPPPPPPTSTTEPTSTIPTPIATTTTTTTATTPSPPPPVTAASTPKPTKPTPKPRPADPPRKKPAAKAHSHRAHPPARGPARPARHPVGFTG